METSAFMKALAETLFISVGQSFVIVLFFKLMFKAVPGIPSAAKYKLWYSSLLLIFLLFLVTLASIYSFKNDEPHLSFHGITMTENHQEGVLDRLLLWEERYAAIIAIFYFSGVFIQLLSLTVSWLKLSRFGKNDLLPGADWEVRLTQLRMKAGVLKDVTLRVSNKITVPLTIGFLKPLILIPVAMLSNMSTGQVEAILLHELAHIKRNDYILNILQRIMEAVLFFNPLVRILSKEIQKEREYCCDEIVVSTTADPLTYANALLIIEEQRNENQLVLAANGNSKYSLLTRIKRLTTMRKINSSSHTGLVALTAIISAGISLAWVVPGPEKEKNTFTVYQNSPSQNKVKQVHLLNENIDTIKRKPETKVESKKKNIRPSKDTTKTVHDNHQWQKLNNELKAASGQIEKLVENQTKFLSSDEWVQHQKDILKHTDEISKHFNSPEWKKIQKEIVINAEQIQKQFNSPEWKNVEKEIEKNVTAMVKKPNDPELKRRQEEIQKKVELFQKKFEASPEWKEKQEDIKKRADEFRLKFESDPVWIEKQEEIKRKSEAFQRKFNEDPEFRNKMKELEKKMEEIHNRMDELELKSSRKP